MHRQRHIGARGGHVPLLQHRQHLENDDRPRAGRPHATEDVKAIPSADRITLLDRVSRQIGLGQVAGVGRVVGNGAHDVGGDGPLIESAGALLGDGAQGGGEIRILEDMADRLRRSVRLVEIGPRTGITARQEFFLPKKAVQTRTDGKTLGGELDRPLEQHRPGKFAVLLMHMLQQLHRAGHADGTPADHRLVVVHGHAVGTQEAFRCRRRRSRLTPIIAGDRPGVGIVMDQEGSAPDPGALRLHQIQHQLHSDGRIHGAAAGAQDGAPGLGRQRIGGGHHMPGRRFQIARDSAGRPLRRRRWLCGRRDGRQHHENGRNPGLPADGDAGVHGLLHGMFGQSLRRFRRTRHASHELFFDKRTRPWQRARPRGFPKYLRRIGVAKPEWGVKRICPSCGARYYDMRKDPPVCPSCGAQFDPEALLKSRKARPAPAEEVVKKTAVVDDEDIEVDAEEGVADIDEVEDDVAVEDIEEGDEPPEDEEDVLIEDTSELGEDDMDEVVDVDGEDDEER